MLTLTMLQNKINVNVSEFHLLKGQEENTILYYEMIENQ